MELSKDYSVETKLTTTFCNLSTFDHLQRLQAIVRVIKLEKCRAEEIARFVKVSTRTVKRDLSVLRKDFKAPLAFDRKQNCFYFTREWRLSDALEEI